MKVSWRNIGDEEDVFQHSHTFVAGQRHDGKTPREFILWLIQASPATNVAVNDKPIWKSLDYGDTEKLVTDALVGKPREASVLITIDYNIQDDWIDNECRSCGMMYGMHSHCKVMNDIDKGWSDVVESAHGR